jgi:hypothetical protein
MKKIVSPLAAGGAPWTNELLLNTQNEIYRVYEGMFKSIVPVAATGNVGIIVSGCEVTGSGPYNCSDGYVFLNGNLLAFPGFSNKTLPQYIIQNNSVLVTDTWANGSVNPITLDLQADSQSFLPGSGQYIAITTAGNIGKPGGRRYENLKEDRPFCVCHSEWSNGAGFIFQKGQITITISSGGANSGNYYNEIIVTHNINTIYGSLAKYTVNARSSGLNAVVSQKNLNDFSVAIYSPPPISGSLPAIYLYEIQIFVSY